MDLPASASPAVVIFHILISSPVAVLCPLSDPRLEECIKHSYVMPRWLRSSILFFRENREVVYLKHHNTHENITLSYIIDK